MMYCWIQRSVSVVVTCPASSLSIAIIEEIEEFRSTIQGNTVNPAIKEHSRYRRDTHVL